MTVRIEPLHASAHAVAALGALLAAVVEAGGSVGFMHPVAMDEADAFWSASLMAAARGERALLGAWSGDRLVATATLILAQPPNQPHRADIAKLMTHPAERGRGLAAALMDALERRAAQDGKTLLVLDTAADEGAGGFYERRGYIRAGEIPDYALKPHGGLTATIYYYKRLAPPT